MTVITTHAHTPTRTIDVGGTTFAYRRLGPGGGTPVIFLNHLAALLDNWDHLRQLPDARLTLYPDAGHGGIFQRHDEFVAEALRFLES